MKAEDIEWMLNAIQENARNLSKWERDFIESVAEQFGNRGTLSERQLEIVDRIYTEKTP